MYHAVTHDDRDPPPPSTPVTAEPAADAASTKKERVLHTRIPAVLEQELKRFADNLRVPVSNLVRTILEDALLAADRATGHVEDQLEHLSRKVAGEREVIREKLKKLDPLEGVVAFQSIVLAQPQACAKCGVSLEPGGEAWLGVTSDPGPRVIVCGECIPSRKPAGNSSENGA